MRVGDERKLRAEEPPHHTEQEQRTQRYGRLRWPQPCLQHATRVRRVPAEEPQERQSN